VAPGACWRISEATPTTCGVDIDVPLLVPEELSLSNVDDRMLDPGANTSMHAP
jgi:hypothetical protein